MSLRDCLLVFFAVCILVFPIVLGLGMTHDMSQDEHQHIAAGALVGREGLLPCRDFPHFHTPYLPFVYALLFRASDHLLTVARLFSVLCATAILGAIGAVAWNLFRSRGRRFASLMAAGGVLLALMTQLFSATSGHAWNHEPALLLTVAAFLAHVAGLRSGRGWWLAASGVLLGLAIGTRITCAPLIAPFGLALFFHAPPPRWHWGRIGAFSGGLLLGLAGVIWFFVALPEQALFANFGFAKTNIAYRLSTGEPRTMTVATKLRFFFKVIVRPDAALFVAGLFPLVAALLANRGSGRRLRFELRLILLLLPFVFMGGFAPSPLFDQYFYPLVPFLVLAGLYAFASIPEGSPWFRSSLLVGAGAVPVAMVMGVLDYGEAGNFFSFNEWAGSRVHEEGREMRLRVDGGRVLTLAPIVALEGGLSIYPALSTGPFAWRIAPYVQADKAARLGIVTPATLGSLLEASPPAAVLLVSGKAGEEPLAEYARGHGYRFVPTEGKKKLWVRPAE